MTKKKQQCSFREFGVAVDCSRNAVYTVETVKKWVGILSDLGYNTLMLYTEDTYEVAGEPFFGYMRGRYTPAEIAEIEDECDRHGIELIPCIQTLAHLETIFSHGKYEGLRDIDSILMEDEPETHALIEKMIKSVRSMFRSKTIHLGMDESNRQGLGRYLLKHGYEEKWKLLSRHVNRVYSIAKSAGFERCKVWYDQFAWCAFGDCFYEPNEIVSKAFCDSLPKDLELVYWDYGTWPFGGEGNPYEHHIRKYREIGLPLSFAGSALKITGLVPANGFSISEGKASIEAAKNTGLTSYLVTIWGDGGDAASLFSVLPTLYANACFAHGTHPSDEEFKEKFGASYSEYLKIDLPDHPNGSVGSVRSFSTAHLFNNVLFGNADGLAYEGLGSAYGAIADELKNIGGEFGYVFRTIEALCRALSVKAELPQKLRKAYREGNKAALGRLSGEIERAVKLVEALERAHRVQWMAERKPFGYEVIAFRYGGLIGAMKWQKERIEAYVSGKVNTIPELDAEQVFDGADPETGSMSWINAFTYNVF